MTTLHKASLPAVRVDFHSISQKPDETILAYTSRVDIIVSTLAKLGEKVSTGAWIYALGNGLRNEYKECKKGILYNEPEFDTILSVKTKLRSEEAILASQKKKESDLIRATKVIEDEIALKLRERNQPTEKSTKEPVDKALMFKGKGNKGGAKGKRQGKGRQWNESEWTPPWSPPATVASLPQAAWNPNSKGNGKGKPNGTQAPYDAQTLWCDIHQQHGHSTDWCFDNPNRTGGPPKQKWCDNHQLYGHSTEECRKGNGPPSPPQQHGKGKGKKGSRGERNWKSQNFPAGYSSDQATPALHDESSLQPPSQQSWWDENELGSSCVEAKDADDSGNDFVPEYDDDEIAAEIDLYFLAVFKNIDRQNEYLLEPTAEKLQEFNEHEGYLLRATSQLNIHSQRIVLRFREQIGYVGCMDTFFS